MEGVLLLDKPEGPTSHDVVNRVRRALGTRRVGHTGTLDPFASGLMLVCVGSATRIAEYLTAARKRYMATVHLGVSTDTDDCTGSVVATADPSHVTDAQLEDALALQRGALAQVPPAYSAKKREGRRAYQLARAGVTVELEPVHVTVHDLGLVRRNGAVVELDVLCSSGTYIRAIARDIGAHLGTGAHLTALRRTEVGRHQVEQAIALASLEDAAAVDRAMITAAAAMREYPQVALDDADVEHIGHGRAVRTDAGDAAVAAFVADDRLVAVGRIEEGWARPRKVLT